MSSLCEYTVTQLLQRQQDPSVSVSQSEGTFLVAILEISAC